MLRDHEEDFKTHGGSRKGWEFYILLADLTGNKLLKVVEELLIRLFMDAEFALSIGDIGMTDEEIAYNARCCPRIAGSPRRDSPRPGTRPRGDVTRPHGLQGEDIAYAMRLPRGPPEDRRTRQPWPKAVERVARLCHQSSNGISMCWRSR